VTAIDCNTAVTVNVVFPDTPPDVAVIVVVPVVTPVASPPAAIVATLAVEEAHVAEEVRSFVLPSL
jgi:hypothetical protein